MYAMCVRVTQPDARNDIPTSCFGSFQVDGVIFNKGRMLNAGFLEAEKFNDGYDCYIFHDVDMLLENRCNHYTCYSQPLHLGAYVNKFKYKLMYETLIGGVLALSRDTIKTVNGYTNMLYGWGAEDDDLSERLLAQGLKILRHSTKLSRYSMIEHGKDDGNPIKTDKWTKRYKSLPRFSAHDGLTNANYSVQQVNTTPLFIHLRVTIDGPVREDQMIERFRYDTRQLEQWFNSTQNTTHDNSTQQHPSPR